MRRNPFEELEEMLDRLGEQVEEGMTGGTRLPGGRSVAVDLADEGETYVLTADLPGFETDDIDLTLQDNHVHIEADRESVEEERDGDRYLRRERHRTSVSRSVRLPEEVDEDAVSARYTNGVLTVTLPKEHAPDESGHHIDIE